MVSTSKQRSINPVRYGVVLHVSSSAIVELNLLVTFWCEERRDRWRQSVDVGSILKVKGASTYESTTSRGKTVDEVPWSDRYANWRSFREAICSVRDDT